MHSISLGRLMRPGLCQEQVIVTSDGFISACLRMFLLSACCIAAPLLSLCMLFWFISIYCMYYIYIYVCICMYFLSLMLALFCTGGLLALCWKGRAVPEVALTELRFISYFANKYWNKSKCLVINDVFDS